MAEPAGPEADPTTVRALLHSARRRLELAGVASPATDAEVLLAHVLGLSRSQLLMAGPVGPEQRSRFHGLVARRTRREPLQHLTGTAAFRRIEVEVGPGVFVPRPETELLAGWAVEQARGRSTGATTGEGPIVVDLCTGSGAIALSLADEVPWARVHAVELDPGAAAWAGRNLAGSGVVLHRADMAEALGELDGRVDVVVCNPPYIPLEAYEGVTAEVRDHDPAVALWSGPDGLEAIRVLERAAARLLRPGGVVGVEHADVQGSSVPAIFTASGCWTEVRDHRDLADRDRFTTARRHLSGRAEVAT